MKKNYKIIKQNIKLHLHKMKHLKMRDYNSKISQIKLSN